MKPNMIKKWSIALLVAAGAAGLTGCEGLRVEEGSSTSNSSGIVADRAITGKLSGVVVDEHGRALEGVTVSAYGLSTTSEKNGTWTLNNVPITNLVISMNDDAAGSVDDTVPTDADSTPPAAGASTPQVVAEGKIYTSFSKPNYATFHSTYEGAIGVITHSGSQDGANSIVVDSISATIPYVELSEMNRTFSGTVYDLGESNYSYQKTVTADVQMRLVPNYVTDDLYGFDGEADGLQPIAGGQDIDSNEFSPGYYGVDPVTVALDGDGKFTIEGAGALRSGYELRVDGTGWRPAQYPQWNTGNEQTLIRVFDANNVAIDDVVNGVAGQTAGAGTGIEDGAYWKIEKLNIATGTNNLVTDFGKLYVQNFEAQDGTDPRVAIISYLGGPDNLDASGGRDFHGDDTVIDSDVATSLGNTTPLVIVFDQDMRSISTMPEKAVRLYDDTLTMVSATAVLDGRTLTITTTENLETGYYRLVLKRDLFVDKNGERLAASSAPSGAFTGGEPDADFDSIFGIQYGTSAYDMAAVTDLKQEADGAIGTATPNILLEKGTTAGAAANNTVEMARVDKLNDSIVYALANSANANDYDYTTAAAAAVNDPDPNKATVSFVAAKGDYELTVTNGEGVEYPATATVTNGTDAITVAVGGATVGLTGTETTFNVASAGTVNLVLDNALVGFTVAVTPRGELATKSGQSLSIELKDQFVPRVALQFSSTNDQDDGTVAIFNLKSSDETGEIAYNGQTQLVYPKLNLTASLYDTSGYRGRSEATDDNTNATAALADDLVTQSLLTPLLATTPATTTGPGTTASGRSDRFYTAADYTAWSQTGSTGGQGVDCNYYYADTVGSPGWVPADYDETTQAVSVDAGRAIISDADVTTWTDNAALTSYVDGGTGLLGSTTVNLIKAASDCEVVTPSTLASQTERTIVIETTEDIASFTFDDAFKDTPGAVLNGPAATTTNVNSGSALDTQLTGLESVAGESHLLATLADWREINESPRWISSAQAGGDVANSIGEGLSSASLLQLVGLGDAAGNTATATDHAVGVVFADATPPLATALVNNGSSIDITFDQPLNLGNNNTFDLVSTGQDDGGNALTYTYTFTLTSSTAGTVARTVSTPAPFVDQFGRATAANAQALAITVATTDSRTYNFAVSATTDNNAAGGNHMSFSHYFNNLTHESANSVDGTATAPTLYIDYPALQDANYNSWNAVAAHDVYDDGGQPRLIGSDAIAPKLSSRDAAGTAVAAGAAAAAPANQSQAGNVFLYPVSAPATVTAAHGNRVGAGVLLTDTDSVFTAATGAGTTNQDDRALYQEWGYDTTTTTGSVTESRVVLKLSAAVTSVGKAYLYFPENEVLSTSSANQNDILVASAALNDGDGAGTAVNAGAADVDAIDSTAIIVGIPDYDAAASRTVSATDRLVIEDVVISGQTYTVHITIPSHAGLTTNTETTGLPTTVNWYKKVNLSTGENDLNKTVTAGTAGAATNFGGLAAGATINLGVGDLELDLNYREDLKSVSAAWSDGADHTTGAVEQVSFPSTLTAAVDSTANQENRALLTLVNPSDENDTAYVGHGATITVNATDFDDETSSTVITLNLGHGVAAINTTAAAATGATFPILNTVSGGGID